MTIKTKLTQNDFIKVNFILLFSKIFIWIIYSVMVLSLLLGIISAFIPNSGAGDFSFSRILTPILVMIFLPVATYFAAKKSYSSNKRISETIDYKFEQDYLIMQGESFESKLTWDKIYKVSQHKNWILIWQTKQVANAIHRADFWDGEIDALKKILTEHGVKNNIG